MIFLVLVILKEFFHLILVMDFWWIFFKRQVINCSVILYIINVITRFFYHLIGAEKWIDSTISRNIRFSSSIDLYKMHDLKSFSDWFFSDKSYFTAIWIGIKWQYTVTLALGMKVTYFNCSYCLFNLGLRNLFRQCKEPFDPNIISLFFGTLLHYCYFTESDRYWFDKYKVNVSLE